MADFIQAETMSIPVVAVSPSWADRLGTIMARLGLIRNHYLVAPGLYAIGRPDRRSEVLVTANYKLSFDAVRFAVPGRNLWLLVLDTCGINVWCAAGKGTFSTSELAHRIRVTGLEHLVEHRRVILPQLGATGVAAHELQRCCGFSVHYGPIRAGDLPGYCDNGFRTEPAMRRITFSVKERAELIPVELYLLGKALILLVPFLFLISGFGSDIYSLARMWQRGVLLVLSLLVGIIAGAVTAPLLLPWLPGRAFAVKGLLTGIGCGALFLMLLAPEPFSLDHFCLFLGVATVSSYLGMNFTGATPYTSPSGVEWEMRRAIPLQALGCLLLVVLWLLSPFL